MVLIGVTIREHYIGGECADVRIFINPDFIQCVHPTTNGANVVMHNETEYCVLETPFEIKKQIEKMQDMEKKRGG